MNPASVPAAVEPRESAACDRSTDSAAVVGTARRADEARRWRSAAAKDRPRRDGGFDCLALARSRRMRQGSRTVLLWGVIFYVVVQLVANYLVNLGRPLWAEVWRTKWPRLCEVAENETDRPLVVMLGSSRTDCALQAGRLNEGSSPDVKPFRIYNFGVPLGGPISELLHLRGLIDRGIRPRLLLVEVLPPFFNKTAPGVANEDTWPLAAWVTLPELVRLWPYFPRPTVQLGQWTEARVACCYHFRPYIQQQMHFYLFPAPRRILTDAVHDPWGYKIPGNFTLQERASSYATVYQLFFAGLRNFKLAKEPSQALRDLLALCRQENIPVALVLMPESSFFRSWYSPEARNSTRRLLAELQSTFQVPLIDANCWMKDEDFYDFHHLQIQGAEQFTRRLGAEVQRLLNQPSAEKRAKARPAVQADS
jgi:hypothetical protein